MSASKDKGTAWETAIVTYLRDHGAPHAERRTLSGNKDRGDIAGIPGVVIEAKNAARQDWATWTDEAQTEAANVAPGTLAIVWAKRRGRSSPGDGYVMLTGYQLITLLTEAGYLTGGAIPPEQGDRPADHEELVTRVAGNVLDDLRGRVEAESAPEQIRAVSGKDGGQTVDWRVGYADALDWVLEQLDDMDENLTEEPADA